jgi:hypothetical protein
MESCRIHVLGASGSGVTSLGRACRRYGGWRHQETAEFIEWASHYEDGDREGPSLTTHQTWLTALHCRVLRLDGSLPELIAEVRNAINR